MAHVVAEVIDLREAEEPPPTDAQRLIRAAWRVLERSGWETLKVERVLAEAGLSTRTFYRHFRSKNELLVVLLEDQTSRAVAQMERFVHASDDPRQQVATWIELMVRSADHHTTAGPTRLFTAAWPLLEREFPSDVDHCRRVMLVPLETSIAAGRDQGLFPGADPETDGLAIHYLAACFMSQMADPATAMAPEVAVACVQRFVLRSLTSTDADLPIRSLGETLAL